MGLFWETDPIYLFDSYIKDENANLSCCGTAFSKIWSIAVVLKFYQITLLHCLLDDFILSVVIYKSSTHCQCQECHEMLIKKKRLSAKWHRDLNLQKRNYHETPENKKQEVNRRYDDKRESAKQYKKDTMWKIKYCI